MKKFKHTKLAAFLLLIGITFTACNKNDQTIAPNNDSETVMRPQNAISLEHYKTYINLYKEQRLKDFNAKHPEFPMGDTQKVWFSIEAMKNYIAYVESVSAAKGIPVTGISFHYGVYPKTKEYGIYGGYQTLVMTPTAMIDGHNRDFEPLQSAYGVPKPFDEATTNNVGIAGKDETTETESSAANRGGVCPPSAN